MNQLLEEALKLPVVERKKLADEIYDSIDSSDENIYLTPEQEAELGRRLEDLKQDPEGNFSWEEIEAEALRRP